MPSHKSHKRPYIEPCRHDELPDGVRDTVQASAGGERRQDGTIVQGARTFPARGGKALKGRTALSHEIEAGTLSSDSIRKARTLRRTLTAEIARSVGGGYCGVAASLFIKFASQKTAAAEEAFQAGDYDTHRKLTESARMDILYAREHAAKEAAARPQVWQDPLAGLLEEWTAPVATVAPVVSSPPPPEPAKELPLVERNDLPPHHPDFDPLGREMLIPPVRIDVVAWLKENPPPTYGYQSKDVRDLD